LLINGAADLGESYVKWLLSGEYISLYSGGKNDGVFSGRTTGKRENDRQRVNFNWHFVQILMPTIYFLYIYIYIYIYI